MSRTAKSTPKEAGATPPHPEPVTPETPESGGAAAFAGMAQKGIETMLEIQKRVLDIAVERTAAAAEAALAGLQTVSPPQAWAILYLGNQGIDRIAAAQKAMLKLAVSEGVLAAENCKQQAGAFPVKLMAEMAGIYEEALAGVAAAQQMLFRRVAR